MACLDVRDRSDICSAYYDVRAADSVVGVDVGVGVVFTFKIVPISAQYIIKSVPPTQAWVWVCSTSNRSDLY